MIGSMILEAGLAHAITCTTSSHFCAAEKQYRFPLEYGGQRPPTAQWTVTGSGAFLLSNNAEKAQMVIKNAKVLYPNKQDYFDQIDKIFMDKMAVEVQEDGKMVIDYKL